MDFRLIELEKLRADNARLKAKLEAMETRQTLIIIVTVLAAMIIVVGALR